MKLRQVLLDGIAQGELSFFGQHHDTDRSNGLCHGHDLEDSVLPHGAARLDVRHTEGVKFDHVIAMSSQRDGTRDGLLVDEVLDPLRDLREDCVVHAGSVSRLG
jgi:hypothetical protein